MKTCPSCGTQNEADATFCIECGTSFSNPPPVVKAPSSPVSKSPLNKILLVVGAIVLFCCCSMTFMIWFGGSSIFGN